MKATRILALLGAMSACCSWGLLGCAAGGDVDEDLDDMGADLSPEGDVGEADLPLNVCGGNCPGGYHPTSYSCNLSCGSCQYGNNQSTCQPDGGTYYTCGGVCAAGYHPTAYSCNQNCGSCAFGLNNQTLCQPG